MPRIFGACDRHCSVLSIVIIFLSNAGNSGYTSTLAVLSRGLYSFNIQNLYAVTIGKICADLQNLGLRGISKYLNRETLLWQMCS